MGINGMYMGINGIYMGINGMYIMGINGMYMGINEKWLYPIWNGWNYKCAFILTLIAIILKKSIH